jgi:ribonuclease Z
MDRIIMLGTGNGGTLDLYNTCFVIQNENGNFLVDTGGGIEIIKRLKQINIQLKDIKNIFISHSHTDHILGLFWIFKKISRMAMHGELTEKINIYCNDVVYEAIKEVSKHILPEKLMNAIYEVCEFIILKDEDKYTINGLKYTFFDIKAKGTKQFGFQCFLNNKRFIFLGDETLNPYLYDKIKGTDYVTHEAFCLDKEENIFHAYKKHHSTALSVAKIMNQLDVKNLILYHTEDSHIEDRKRLYTEEAQSIFSGNVIVPNDLEEIEID